MRLIAAVTSSSRVSFALGIAAGDSRGNATAADDPFLPGGGFVVGSAHWRALPLPRDVEEVLPDLQDAGRPRIFLLNPSHEGTDVLDKTTGKRDMNRKPRAVDDATAAALRKGVFESTRHFLIRAVCDAIGLSAGPDCPSSPSEDEEQFWKKMREWEESVCRHFDVDVAGAQLEAVGSTAPTAREARRRKKAEKRKKQARRGSSRPPAPKSKEEVFAPAESWPGEASGSAPPGGSTAADGPPVADDPPAADAPSAGAPSADVGGDGGPTDTTDACLLPYTEPRGDGWDSQTLSALGVGTGGGFGFGFGGGEPTSWDLPAPARGGAGFGSDSPPARERRVSAPWWRGKEAEDDEEEEARGREEGRVGGTRPAVPPPSAMFPPALVRTQTAEASWRSSTMQDVYGLLQHEDQSEGETSPSKWPPGTPVGNLPPDKQIGSASRQELLSALPQQSLDASQGTINGAQECRQIQVHLPVLACGIGQLSFAESFQTMLSAIGDFIGEVHFKLHNLPEIRTIICLPETADTLLADIESRRLSVSQTTCRGLDQWMQVTVLLRDSLRGYVARTIRVPLRNGRFRDISDAMGIRKVELPKHVREGDFLLKYGVTEGSFISFLPQEEQHFLRDDEEPEDDSEPGPAPGGAVAGSDE